MEQETNNLSIALNFLSTNMLYFVILIVVILLRKSLSSFIAKLTSMVYKSKDSELQLSTETRPQAYENELIPFERKQSEKISDSNPDVVVDNWKTKVEEAINICDFDLALEVFKEYEYQEKNSEIITKEKAIFLYDIFKGGHQDYALEQLNKLIGDSLEDTKFEYLFSLSSCYNLMGNYKLSEELWRNNIENFESENLKTFSTIKLCMTLSKQDKIPLAKEIIIEKLKSAVDKKDKYELYISLSELENKSGDSVLSTFCKNKSQEYVFNINDLFDSAYSASQNHLVDIAVSNYISILKADSKNAGAMNNLGVEALEKKFLIEAVDNYSLAAELGNTLAMANRGFMLLDAGFHKEAEDLVDIALNSPVVHENIHKLKAKIISSKNESKEKWEELTYKYESRKLLFRTYIEKYYLGSKESLYGEWLNISDDITYSNTIDSEQLCLSWDVDSRSTSCKIVGVITGSSFRGVYSEERGENNNGRVYVKRNLGDTQCFGYLTEDNKLLIVPKDINSNMNVDFEFTRNT